jgi:hypothetical protein
MNMTSFLSAVAVGALIASANLVHAQSVDELKIEERSVFTMATARNPFLPIGWKKPEPIPVGVSPSVVPQVSDAFFKPEKFVVTSISIGILPLALINGKPYGEGDLILVSEGINVQVAAIRDGRVTLRYRDKTIESRIQTGVAPKR